MEDDLKEVYFDQYCKSCKNWEKKEHEDPCNECLAVPANVCSHKPVKYEEKK